VGFSGAGRHDGRKSSGPRVVASSSPAGRRPLTAATETVEDELVDRLGSAGSDRALQQFSNALTKLRIAYKRESVAQRRVSLA
jgi:hypothetical protein